jgi:hypothetical protein
VHTFRKIAVAVLLSACLLGGAVIVQGQTPADRQYRCEHRIRRAEANLHRAIRRYGERSRQAERRRRELAEVRARCGSQL